MVHCICPPGLPAQSFSVGGRGECEREATNLAPRFYRDKDRDRLEAARMRISA